MNCTRKRPIEKKLQINCSASLYYFLLVLYVLQDYTFLYRMNSESQIKNSNRFRLPLYFFP